MLKARLGRADESKDGDGSPPATAKRPKCLHFGRSERRERN
jgi:hypothetical protein